MLLESLLRRTSKEPEPKTIPVNIGPLIVKATGWKDLWLLQQNPHNLECAQEAGIKPLTFKELIDQVEPSMLNNAVLFDTPPDGQPGNHFRIIEQDAETKLQLCNTFGSYDHKGILPFYPSSVYPMFTGVSIQLYRVHEKPATLEEAGKAFMQEREDGLIKLITKNVHYFGDKISWSNANGILIPDYLHPVIAPLIKGERQLPLPV